MTASRNAGAWESDARSPNLTLPDAEPQDPERYRLYRLCQCGECSGTGKQAEALTHTDGIILPMPAFAQKIPRCKACRGEGRSLDLVATCGTPEAVGTALVTLGLEGEWDECPIGIMHRPQGQTGKWLVKPWLPSARNLSDAGRTLASARHK